MVRVWARGFRWENQFNLSRIRKRRDYAKSHGIKDIKVAVEEGMKEKSREFVEQGADVYREV